MSHQSPRRSYEREWLARYGAELSAIAITSGCTGYLIGAGVMETVAGVLAVLVLVLGVAFSMTLIALQEGARERRRASASGEGVTDRDGE